MSNESQYQAEFPYVFFYTIGEEPMSNFALLFEVDHEIVKSIEVVLTLDHDIRELSDPFALDEILTEFHRPSRVLVGTRVASADPEYYFPYELWIFFEMHGIVVHYTGPREPYIEQDIVTICPVFEELEHIELYLHSPEDDLSLQDVVDQHRGVENFFDTQIKYGDLYELEIATEVSIDDFYVAFSQSDSDFCLETPENLWH